MRANAVMATVSRSDVDVGDALEVALSTSDAARVIVPNNVVIAAGQTSVNFAVGVIDNQLIEPSQLVVITASTEGLVGATTTLSVLNDDFDSDSDGVLDGLDNCPTNANPDQADFEGDGIGDACDSDRDGDGLPDAYEIANGLDPLNSLDRDADPDGDGFTNIEEFNFGTDPQSADADVDGNGIPDSVDAAGNSVPFLPAILNLLLDDQ